jgi:hypothetical protein
VPGARQTPLSQIPPEIRFVDDAFKGASKCGCVSWWNEDGGISRDLRNGPSRGSNNRKAARHRLKDRKAERFIK